MNHSIGSVQFGPAEGARAADVYQQKIDAHRQADSAGRLDLSSMLQEAVAKKPSEISEAHKTLVISVEALHQALSKLVARLEPVTTPQSDAKSEGKAPPPAASSLGRAIYDQAESVQAAERRVRDLLYRLALE